MLSEILAEVQKSRNSPIGQKRRSLTPKIDPMVRKKRRKTMIQLPATNKTENVETDDLSLRYITNGILKDKNIEDETTSEPQPPEEKEKENKPPCRSHEVLERLTTPTRAPKPSPRRHSIGTCRTKRLSFDGLFRKLASKPERLTFTPPRIQNKSEVKNFYEIFKQASAKTKNI